MEVDHITDRSIRQCRTVHRDIVLIIHTRHTQQLTSKVNKMSHDKKRIRDLWNFVSILAHKNGKDEYLFIR